ncbi:MAG: valine--pyruvate transaminase [Spirochaetia bacterium]
MNQSIRGERYTAHTGISQLMDDLGKALAGTEKKYMLGGGNPAVIPEAAALWRRRMREILDNGDQFDRMVGLYDAPQGRPQFLTALADRMKTEFGWPITERNIVVTNGSQAGFFMLFTLLAGPHADGTRGKILFPLLPEYIGYRDQPQDTSDFEAFRPKIELIDEHTHKYHIDFDALNMTDDTAAICVSRPTNPSGNVLTDEEIRRLDGLARDHDVPLIIDNAYGVPFPGIIFQSVTPIWNENIIFSMSLSKIGLPSLRTGILIACEETVAALSAMNAVLSLANGSVGQTLVEDLLSSGELLSLSRSVVRPYYEEKSERAVAAVHRHFGDRFPYSLHRTEGSIFLWIWFKELPGTTRELYDRLKARDVIVVPGEYFFFGNDEPWEHRDRCIRVNYAMDTDDVDAGIRIIAEEAELMWKERG